MSDYISRASLFNACANLHDKAEIFAAIQAAPAVDVESLKRELQNCRDELCLHCGNYKRAHLGHCNGCRWKEM